MAGVKISRIFSGCTFFVCYDMSFPFRFSAVKEQSEFGAGNVIKIWMIWINLSATVHARHGLYSRRVIWQTANEIWMHSTPHMYINVLGCAFNIEKNKKQNSSPHFPSIAGMNSVSKLVVYSSTSAQFSSVRSCTRRFGELKKKKTSTATATVKCIRECKWVALHRQFNGFLFFIQTVYWNCLPGVVIDDDDGCMCNCGDATGRHRNAENTFPKYMSCN